MRKLIVIFLIVLITSCSVAVFDKLNYFGLTEAMIYTSIDFSEISVAGDVRTLQAQEYHEYADVNTTVVVDLNSISTALMSGGTASIPDDWSYVPSPEEQSGLPIYTLLHILGILSYQDLAFEGAGGFSGTFEGVTYSVNSSASYVNGISFPTGTAAINGWESDFFDTAMLDGGAGELIHINFQISSVNSFLDGYGEMLISSGYPNGLLYLFYDHSTDYSTVAWQNYGSGSSGLFFSTPYYSSYDWYTMEDGNQF